MRKNALVRLFEDFNKNKVKYCVRRRYKHLPNKLIGDVDFFIERKSMRKALEIIKKRGFVYYPFTKPHLFFSYYDRDIGLVRIDILVIKKLIPVKKFRNFYVPKEDRLFTSNKKFPEKVQTFLRRRLYHLFRGKLVCFVAPDGGGKSSMREAVQRALKDYPIEKRLLHFGSRNPGRVYRVFDLLGKIGKTYINIFLGRLTLTDRYIYLTFRKGNRTLRRIIKFISPKPDIVFVMKVDYKTLKKRRGHLCLSREDVKELYRIFDGIREKKYVNSGRAIKENLEYTVNEILGLYR